MNENNENFEKNNSIENYILTQIPIVPETFTVKQTLEHIEKNIEKYHTIDHIYAVDKNQDLSGMISIQNLFKYERNIKINEFMKKDLISVSTHTQIEKAAQIALKHNLKQIPVTKSKKLIGIIPPKEILSTINKSLKTDIFHLAGVHKSHLEYETNPDDTPIISSLKNRLPWLIIGLFGAIIMAAFISNFEETLAKYLIIAAFIPTIVYISGALSSQTLIIFIRDLAVMGKGLNFKNYFFKQIITSIMLSFFMGVALFLLVTLFWSLPYIALVIAIATFVSLIATNFISMLIAILIKRFKFDPALGSGPIATVIADISSVVIYFGTVVILL